jgi:hypothetical protein
LAQTSVQAFEEAATVEIVVEDGFAVVAAVHHVVKGAGIFDPEFAGPARKAVRHHSNRQTKNMRLCGTDPVTWER